MTDQAVPDAPPEASELTASIDAALDRLAATFAGGRTRDVAWRQDQLDALARLLEVEADRLGAALTADLGKPPVEGWITDIASTATEVAALRKGVAKWARPQRRRLGLPLKPSRGEVVPEPLGSVLVLAPWNYPVQLIVAPLAAAIAAGNVVVAKPSELAPATSAALAELLPRYLDPAAVAVFEGGPEVAEALLERRFDHILFTGSTRIGRVVMEAAARHLTPVTLELGGKSPVVVDASADLDVASRRIAWGKGLNAGQTCVAPDYVLVERSVRDRLVDGIAARWREFYGDDPQASADYGRIVDDRHVSRLAGLLVDTEVAVGGRIDLGDRYVEPTLVVDPDPDSDLMTEEIFGPILPVVTYDSLDEAVAVITGRSKPLALYVFSSDDDAVERVLTETSAGGVCVNNVVVHVGSPELPFGGVGDSGMGRYHGRAGFDAMSNPKAVLRSPTRPDLPVLYPPYTRWKEKLLRRVAG